MWLASLTAQSCFGWTLLLGALTIRALPGTVKYHSQVILRYTG
jgi:hypothetical protein